MANNYTLFSDAVANLTAAEEAWLKEQLQIVCVFGDNEYAEDDIPEALRDTSCDWEGPRFMRDNKEYDPDSDCLTFQYEFRDDPDGGRILWVYSEENGDPGQVAYLVQCFLRKFAPDRYWSMTWACTCDKPRLGEFDGGAVLVTARRIRYFSPDAAVQDVVKKLKLSESR